MSFEKFSELLKVAKKAKSENQAKAESLAKSDYSPWFDVIEEYGRKLIRDAMDAITEQEPEKFNISHTPDAQRIGLMRNSRIFGVTLDDRATPEATLPTAYFVVELVSGNQFRILRSPGESPGKTMNEPEPKRAQRVIEDAITAWFSELAATFL